MFLTAEEFINEMNHQDIAGKHGATQTMWRIVADYASQHSVDPLRPFVLVLDLPINCLEAEHAPEHQQLVLDYAQQKTKFPPIFVALTNYQLSVDPLAGPKVKNGNHRVEAARLRGDTTIDAIMTRETWENVRKLL